MFTEGNATVSQLIGTTLLATLRLLVKAIIQNYFGEKDDFALIDTVDDKKVRKYFRNLRSLFFRDVMAHQPVSEKINFLHKHELNPFILMQLKSDEITTVYLAFEAQKTGETCIDWSKDLSEVKKRHDAFLQNGQILSVTPPMAKG